MNAQTDAGGTGPLDRVSTVHLCAGVKVIDLTQGMAGPMAAMVLADYGADVVKVEPPGGDWARGTLRGFHMWNRGKRSIALDLTDPAAHGELLALLRWADVVLTDARPAVARRLGIDERVLHTANPAIVHCHIGTWAGAGDDDLPVFEAQLAAAVGQMTDRGRLSGKAIGSSRSDPTFVLPPVNSYAAAMLAVQGVVAALLGRNAGEQGGRGECLGTSLLQGAMAMLMREDLALPLAHTSGAGDDDVMQRGIELCFLTAQCADDRFIQMCARQDHHFRAWLQALGLEQLLEEPRFAGAPLRIASTADVDELERLLRERMRTRSQAEWMKVFTTDYDLGADPFLTPEEFLEHPQMVDNGRVVVVDDPALGRTVQIGGLVAVDGDTPRRFAAAPVLDADGDRVREQIITVDRHDDHRLTAAAAANSSSTLPLAGVTILEIAYFVAGPLATTLMAELGARVIKVEPISGDPYRRTGLQAAKFLAGKESIALDLKHPDAQGVLHRLIARSDALVHGFREGVPRRLGMDEATARALRPDIVYLNAASYGSQGPESGRIAFHSTPTALSGAGISQAGRGNGPVDDSFPDPAAGLGAATALALGLLARARSGRGASLETTMLTSTALVMSNDLVVDGGGAHASIADAEQLGLCATYRLYECADGWVFIAAVGALQASVAATALGINRLPDGDEERARQIAAVLATSSVAEATSLLRQAGIAVSPVNMGTIDHWLEQQGLLRAAEHPAFGRYFEVPPKVVFAGRHPQPKPICSVGEHTLAVLDELGYPPEEIDALLASGAALCPDRPGGDPPQHAIGTGL